MSAAIAHLSVRIMRIRLWVILLVALAGCSPPTITKKQYDQRYQEAVNLHNTLIGQVHYQGSKDGYDYFYFEPVGAPSRRARTKEGEVPVAKRFPYTEDRKNWNPAPPNWAGATNIVIQSGATNAKF